MKSKIIIIVVAIVVAGLFATGILSWKKWSAKARQGYYQAKGAISSDSSSKGNPDSARICRENLKMIESAKRAVASKQGITVGEVSLSAVLQEMKATTLPKCPDGGEYTLGKLNEAPRCTKGGMGTTDPADDHILKNF